MKIHYNSRTNSVIYTVLLVLFIIFALTSCEPSSQVEKRSDVFLCAERTLFGIAAAQFANRADCEAGETNLLADALADAFDKCKEFCEPTGCAENPPDSDDILVRASACRGPGQTRKFYRDASTNAFECQCITAIR